MLDKIQLSLKAKSQFSGSGAGLFAPDRADDAIALYDEIRAVDPVFRLDDRMWLLTRYDDARAVLRDNVRFSSQFEEEDLDHDAPNLERSILGLDPPDHTRLRGLVQQAFQPRRIKQLEGDIERAVDRLLDGVEAKGEMDVIADLAQTAAGLGDLHHAGPST